MLHAHHFDGTTRPQRSVEDLDGCPIPLAHRAPAESDAAGLANANVMAVFEHVRPVIVKTNDAKAAVFV